MTKITGADGRKWILDAEDNLLIRCLITGQQVVINPREELTHRLIHILLAAWAVYNGLDIPLRVKESEALKRNLFTLFTCLNSDTEEIFQGEVVSIVDEFTVDPGFPTGRMSA